MIGDRHLVELAAVAAGVEGCYASTFGGADNFTAEGIYLGRRRYWNPLTDDGDALRLAVKLGLFVDAYSPATTVGNVVCRESLACKTRMEDHNGDPYAATRRAITRAAAEIGRAMTQSAALKLTEGM